MSAALDVVAALAVRTWSQTLRRPVTLSFSFVQPLLWMAFFGFLFHRFEIADAGAAYAGLSYLDFLTPGVAAMSVLFGASQSGIGWIRDLQTGFLPRLLHTPAPAAALLAGKVAADVVRLLVQAAGVVALALLLGARLRPDPSALPAALAALALFAAAFASLSCAIALRTRAQEAMATFVHVVNMPLLFTSTALVPAKQMPAWLATVAAWNPLTLAVDAWRGALLGTGPVNPLHLAALGAVALVLFAVAAREMGRSGFR